MKILKQNTIKETISIKKIPVLGKGHKQNAYNTENKIIWEYGQPYN